MTEPELSIVVAASHAQRSIHACLQSLDAQVVERNIEVLVACNTAADARLVQAQFPRFSVIETDPGCLVPQLWSAGIGRARGRIIALTTAACVPDAHWVDETLRAHVDYHSAIGGAVEIAPDADLLGWAIYLVRYTRFMLPLDDGPSEVPAENGSYKRAAIADQLDWIAANGFWEQNVNAHLRAQMRSLRANPDSIVTFRPTDSLGGEMRRQFARGQLVGAARARRSPPGKRGLYICASPAIPLLRLWRIAQDVRRKRRHALPLLLSLPLIVWILACGAAGEFVGMARG